MTLFGSTFTRGNAPWGRREHILQYSPAKSDPCGAPAYFRLNTPFATEEHGTLTYTSEKRWRDAAASSVMEGLMTRDAWLKRGQRLTVEE